MNVREAARLYNLPYETLRRRVCLCVCVCVYVCMCLYVCLCMCVVCVCVRYEIVQIGKKTAKKNNRY